MGDLSRSPAGFADATDARRRLRDPAIRSRRTSMGLVHGRPTNTDTVPFYVPGDRQVTACIRASNELAVGPVSMARGVPRPACHVKNTYLASHSRYQERKRDECVYVCVGRLLVFHRCWTTLEKIHLDCVAIAVAAQRRQEFLLGNVRMKVTLTPRSFPIVPRRRSWKSLR